MTVQYVQSRIPSNDIDFAKGTGFVVANDEFLTFLKGAVDDQKVSANTLLLNVLITFQEWGKRASCPDNRVTE